MAITVTEIEAVLRLRDELSAKLKVASRNISQAGDDLVKAGRRAQEFGNAMMPISIALGGAAAASLKMASDFESAMLKVVTIAGEAEDKMGEMRDGVMRISEGVGVGPKALADALLVVESTGIKGGVALDILERSAKSTAVGLGETKDIARAITAAMTAYAAENMTAARASDVLFNAVKLGGAEATEFAGSLGRVIGISAQVGVSFEEVSGFIATFTRLGIDADEAVTSLRGVMTTILDPSKQARDMLASFGLTIQDVRDKVKKDGLAAAMTELVEVTKSNDEAMATIFGNVRALAGVLGTAGSQAEVMRKIMDDLGNSTGVVDEAMRKVAETSAYKWASFRAELERTAIAFGDELAPYAMKALDSLKFLLDVVKDAIALFTSLPGFVQKTILVIGALAIAAWPVASAIGSITVAAGNLAQGFGWFLGTGGGKAVVAIFDSLILGLKGLAVNFITTGTAANTFMIGLGKLSVVLAPLALIMAIVMRSQEHYNEEEKESIRLANEAFKAQMKAQGSWQNLGTAVDGASKNLQENLTLREKLLDPKMSLADIFSPQNAPKMGRSGGGSSGGGVAPPPAALDTSIADALEAIKDKQKDIIAQAKAWSQFAGSSAGKLPLKVQEEYYDALQAVIDQFGSLEAKGMGSLNAVHARLSLNVGATKEMLTQQEAKNKEAAANILEAWLKQIAGERDARWAAYEKAGDALDKWRSKNADLAAKIVQDHIASIQAVRDVQDQANTELLQRSLSSYNAQVLQIYQQAEEQKKAYAIAYGYSQEFYDAVDALAKQKVAGLSTTWTQFFSADLPKVIMSAVTGGGNVGEAIGASVGGRLADGLSKTLGDKIKEGGEVVKGPLTKAFGSTIGGAIGSVIPVIGPIIGQFAGKLFGAIGYALKGGAGAEANDVRDALKEKLAGAIAGLENDPDVRAAMARFNTAGKKDDVNKSAEAAMAAAERAKAAMAKYGLSLDDVGSSMDKFMRAQRTLAQDVQKLGELGFSGGQIGEAAEAQIRSLIEMAKAAGLDLQDLARTPVLGDYIAKVLESDAKKLAEEAAAAAEKIAEETDKLRASLGQKLASSTAGFEGVTGVRAGIDKVKSGATQEDIQAGFDQATEAADRARGIMQSYGLTLEDTKSKAEQFREAQKIMSSEFATLAEIGFSVETVVGKSAGKLNELLAVALETGEPLAASMRPYVEELIRSGQITEELAAKMLGVPAAVPWKDMEEAAKKYGIEVGALGNQFAQAKLTETSSALLADWELLVTNGADINAVMEGMGDEVSDMVENAIKHGLELPEAMKPMIEKMAEAGELVDDQGVALEGIGEIKWSKPVISETDKLILKLDELIGTMTGKDGIGKALEDISKKEIKPGVDKKEITDAIGKLKDQNGLQEALKEIGEMVVHPVIDVVVKWPDMDLPKSDTPYMPVVRDSDYPGVTLAEGGIVTRPTIALIGEAGPEAVVPLSGGGTSRFAGLDSGSDVVSEMRKLRREMTSTIPALVAIAARDAALLARR